MNSLGQEIGEKARPNDRRLEVSTASTTVLISGSVAAEWVSTVTSRKSRPVVSA